MRRWFEWLRSPTLDKSVECCSCLRQQQLDGKAWIYCEIYSHQMCNIAGFDETGETEGCSKHEQ